MKTIIHPKIDYYTSIWHNSRIRDVLEFLQLEDRCYDFLNDVYNAVRGIDTNFVFRYNDIELSVCAAEFYLYYDDPDQIDISVCDTAFKRIRLNLSGAALDYLRTIGYNVDKNLRANVQFDDYRPYHVTRCDFAFDFVNYNEHFIDDLMDYLYDVQRQGHDRVRFMRPDGRGYSLKYSLKFGGQKTIYLGSPQADKLLRIYDKGMEFSNSGKPMSDLPFVLDDDGIHSWFRIELQLRNSMAENMLFALCDDESTYSLSLLHWIYDNYMFRRMDINVCYDSKPCAFWEKLWQWDIIPDLITQNTKSVYISFADKLVQGWESGRYMIRILHLIDFYGIDKFLKDLDEYLIRLQLKDDDPEQELKRQIRLRTFLSHKNEYTQDERCGNYIGIDDSGNLYLKNYVPND